MTDQTVTLRLTGENGQLLGSLSVSKKALGEFGVAGAKGGEQAATGLRKTTTEAGRTVSVMRDLRNTALAYFSVAAAFQGVRWLRSEVDGYANLTAKIRLATDSQAEYAAAEEAVFNIAQRTSSSLDSTARLYSRINAALKDQGASQREVLGITETVNQALAVSGATTAEAAGAVTQLSQAFASGTLRGDEFNSVNEAAPRLMQALAESLGVTRGELRKMAEEGELSSSRLRAALSGIQADEIAAEFAQLPLTIERAFVQLDNAVQRYIGKADEASGSSRDIAEAIQFVAQNIGTLISGLLTATKIFLAYQAIFVAAPAIYARATAALATYGSTVAAVGVTQGAAMAGSLAALGAVRVAGGALFAAFAGWQIGEYLNDQFTIVRVAGLGMVRALLLGWETLKAESLMAWEILKAGFFAAIDAMTGRLASFISIYADALSKVNVGGVADGAVESLRGLATQLKPTRDAAADLEVSLAGIRDTALQNMAAINQNIDEMQDFEIAQQYAKTATEGATDAIIAQGAAAGLTAAELEKLRREAERRAAAELAFVTQTASMRAALDGPLAQALDEYKQGMIEATKALQAHDITLQQFEDRKQVEIDMLNKSIAAIDKEKAARNRAALAPIRQAAQSADNELRLARATADQRERIRQEIYDEYQIHQLIADLEERKEEIDEATYQAGLKDIKNLEKKLELLRQIEQRSRLRSIGIEGILGESFDEAFKSGGETFGDAFKKRIKDVFSGSGENGSYTANDVSELAQFTASAADFVSFVKQQADLFKDAPYRAMWNVASKIPGIVGDIADAVLAVDALFGGKWLGTAYELDKSARNINFSNSGASGSTSVTEVKQQSFFRGRKWKTTTSALDAETQDALDDMFIQIGLAVAAAARELGATAVDLVAGSFAETFDKNGKLTSSISTVLGKKYNESFEDFTKRISAENLIAVLDQVLPSAELQRIADQWRDDADILAEGAGLLFAIASDMNRAQQLWTATGDGVLTNLVALVTDLQLPGEQLAQTYARLNAAARAYGAVVATVQTELLTEGLSGFARAVIDVRREELVRIKTLQDQARALGNLEAREEDLADVRASAAAKIARLVKQLELETADILAELYGTPLEQINEQIAALTGISDGAAGSLKRFMDSLLLSQQLSPLTDSQKRLAALGQVNAAVASGNVEGFTTAAQAFLEISRRLRASGADYNSDFDLINTLAGQLGGTGPGTGGNLADLIAQRDAILAQQEAAKRLNLATQLATNVADLAGARGVGVMDVLASLGIDPSRLQADLGLSSLADLTSYLEDQIADTDSIAQILYDLPERIAQAMYDILYARYVPAPGTVVDPPVYQPPGDGSGTGSGGDPGTGTGTGDCVVVGTFLERGVKAEDMVLGTLGSTHLPGSGFHPHPLEFKGMVSWQPCVLLTTEGGAQLALSNSTPFNDVDAIEDLQPGKHRYAPDMLGHQVWAEYEDEHGFVEIRRERVVRVQDMGLQPVVPLGYGGRSFPAGVNERARIYSHNAMKGPTGGGILAPALATMIEQNAVLIAQLTTLNASNATIADATVEVAETTNRAEFRSQTGATLDRATL